MKDHTNLIEAARVLRKRLEQQGDAVGGAMDRAAHVDFLLAVEDFADRVLQLEKLHGMQIEDYSKLLIRVASIERSQRRMHERLEFLGHIGRLLGYEDWTLDDPPNPGALATAAQANVSGASGAGELVPPGSPASVT